MKLNNRGFAISAIMYTILVLAVLLMFSILSIIVNRKLTVDKVKKSVQASLGEGLISDVPIIKNLKKNESDITFTIVDTDGIEGYAVTNTNEEPSEWISTESALVYNGTYAYVEIGTFWIYAKDIDGNVSYKKFVVKASEVCPYDLGQTWPFETLTSVQQFPVPCDAVYKLEVYGSQGQSVSSTYAGGKGGYSVGNIKLATGTTLFVVTGSITYNGGGAGNLSGGGATHIAYVTGTLSTIGYEEAVTNGKVLIVAGGGGGAATHGSSYGTGGAGGGTAGGGSNCPYSYAYAGGAGSQTGAGAGGGGVNSGSFGQGGTKNVTGYGGGGGGGLYGGGGSNYYCGGGGGSGYLSPVLTDTSMTAGTNTGTGKATITLVSF